MEVIRQPVQADADIIITNFFQVQKLLFAHGFYSHQQISKLIYFYIYKNVVLVGSEIAFQFVCGFSREQYYIGIFISSYNLVLSTLQAFVALTLEHRNFN